jgi:hypothetical protein
MDIFITNKVDLVLAVQKMIGENGVYGVKQKAPSFAFDKLFAADELRLDHNITVLSPNQYLVPILWSARPAFVLTCGRG